MKIEGIVRSCYRGKIILYIDDFNKKIVEASTGMKISNYLTIETNFKKMKRFLDQIVVITLKKKQPIVIDGDIMVNLRYKLKSIEAKQTRDMC